MRLPAKRPGLKENLTGSELFIYEATGEELSVLNASALFIWSLCDGTHDSARMVEMLSEIYPDVSQNRLREDIDACLRSLRQKQLIVGS